MTPEQPQLRSPLAWVRRRRLALWLLAGLTLALGLAQMPALDTMGDQGVSVLELELMRTAARAAEVMSDLGQEGRDAARTHLAIDYPYLVAYGLFLSLACTAIAARAREHGSARWQRIGELLAWGALGAALCDATENTALLAVLDGHTDQPFPGIAWTAALAKFALSLLATGYALAGWVRFRRRRRA